MARDPADWTPPRWQTVPGSAAPFGGDGEFAFNVQYVIPELPEYFDPGDTVTFQALFLAGGHSAEPTIEFESPDEDRVWWGEYFRMLREAWRDFFIANGLTPGKSPNDAQPIYRSVERNNETLVFGRPR